MLLIDRQTHKQTKATESINLLVGDNKNDLRLLSTITHDIFRRYVAIWKTSMTISLERLVTWGSNLIMVCELTRSQGRQCSLCHSHYILHTPGTARTRRQWRCCLHQSYHRTVCTWHIWVLQQGLLQHSLYLWQQDTNFDKSDTCDISSQISAWIWIMLVL